MFAGESNELVALATLWNLDAIAVGPLLDLAVAPALEELIAERLSGASSRLGSRSVLLRSLVGGDLGVTAKGSNELITVTWLRDRNTALIEPGLQVRVGPLGVEPVARVGSSLTSLLGGLCIVGAGGVQKGIASAR